ncbi:MAG: hypothetical protein IJY69_03515 [Clostridia bacterium]|nr:hypothetical protein [Clostridia bacterium]
MTEFRKIENYGDLPAAWEKIMAEPLRIAVKDGDKALTFRDINREIASFRMKLHTFHIGREDRMAVVISEGVKPYKVLIALASRGVSAVLLPHGTAPEKLVKLSAEMDIRGCIVAREDVPSMNAVRDAIPGYVVIDASVIGDGEAEATPDEEATAVILSGSEMTLRGRCFGCDLGDTSYDSLLRIEGK